MLDRANLWSLSFFCLASLVGCSNTGLTGIQVTPSTQSLTQGTTAQFVAIGSYQHGPQGSHPTTSNNITSTVNWSSSAASVATVSASGLATAVGPGTATITASTNGFQGLTSGTATLTVTAKPEPVLSLSIIPGSQGVSTPNETGQFIAIANSATTPMDLTNQVNWSSSDAKVATIGASGLATGLNPGSTTITAIASNPDGSVVTATATFTEGSGTAGTRLPTLTVYKVGNNAATGLVTATETGTTAPLVINCGTGAGCVGNFTLGSSVVLTATPGPGSTFGGWSSNCSAATPNQCTVMMTDNDTVGAIFN